MKPVAIPLSISTIYLIPCRGGFLQVDTGYYRDYGRYRRQLKHAGIPLSDVKYMLLTHHHDDHAGFLNEITRDTALTVIAHEKARALLQTGANDRTRGGGYINSFVKRIADVKMRLDPQWTLTFPPFEMRAHDVLIGGDDEQVLRQLGIAGRILYTPGHCIDHLALVLDSGEVLCGDAAASFLLWAGVKYCAVFMTDMEESYRSWQKLLDAGGKVFYPSHGKPFSANKLRQHMGRVRTNELVRFF
jgi:glyoxylase-like metal-dependent hydrolase (beta-lactamase superfamily II)